MTALHCLSSPFTALHRGSAASSKAARDDPANTAPTIAQKVMSFMKKNPGELVLVLVLLVVLLVVCWWWCWLLAAAGCCWLLLVRCLRTDSKP